MSYKWEVLALPPAKRRAYFCKDIAMQMGAVLPVPFKSIAVRGCCDSHDFSSMAHWRKKGIYSVGPFLK